MNLKQAILSNKGMHQDLSISKDTQEYAYKNINIRIQATGDGTIASVTNIKSPLKVSDTVMKGRVLNSIMCGEYIVVFTHMDVPDVSTPNVKDYIYRIDLDNIGNTPDNSINVLYAGDLNFSYDKPIDSTFYYENDNIQKVYWVDGWTTDGINNYPRVINIISDGERNGGDFTTYNADTNFDFYPEIKYVPTINVVKNFGIPSELPAGVIQYFVSFFNKNQSETLIAAGTSLYSIDLKSRGAKADETGCAFDVTIQIENESTVQDEWASSYEYIRLYSVRRTSIDGDATVSIVRDFKIEENVTSYSTLDNGIGQETIDPGQIFFIGGTPLFAKTLCQKDNTLFVGGIKTEEVLLSTEIKDTIDSTINREGSIYESSMLIENYKTIPVSDTDFDVYYPYKLQKDSESIVHKTFKTGEIYRFGIQFQTKQGQWSEVVWIGDKKIINFPTYNDETSLVNPNTFNVSNIKFSADSTVTDLFEDLQQAGFVNYRLLMADPEYSNGRSVIAQGIVCPTMFNSKLRTDNAPHTFSSWIMRPRNCNMPCHHLEPLNSAQNLSSELSTYDPIYKINVDNLSNYEFHSIPFEFIGRNSNEYSKTEQDNNFYIDESIVSLHSPEINENTKTSGSPKFRIVGITPLTANYSSVQVETDNIGVDLDYIPNIDTDILNKYRVPSNTSKNISPIYSEYMYKAPNWVPNESAPYNVTKLDVRDKSINSATLYNIHMWQHSKSIVGFDINNDKVKYQDSELSLTTEPLILKKNVFYNFLFSNYNQYFETSLDYPLTFGVGLLIDTNTESIKFKQASSDLYYGVFDYIHENTDTQIYRNTNYQSMRDKTTLASSRITFNSNPHAVFYLGKDAEYNQLEILPRFSGDETLSQYDSNRKEEIVYNGVYTGKYLASSNVWENIKVPGGHTPPFLNTYFNNKLRNSFGLKLGASWIGELAQYEDTNDTSEVYNYQSYLVCCAVVIGSIRGQHDRSLTNLVKGFFNPPANVEDRYSITFGNYNYRTGGNLTVMAYVTDSDEGYHGTKLVKVTWPNHNQHDWNDITITDPSDFEMSQTYPILCHAEEVQDFQYYNVIGYYSEIWEGTRPLPDQDYYRILIPNYLIEDNTTYCIGEVFKTTILKKYMRSIYTQRDIGMNLNTPDKPYLFLGELYYDITYNDLYGGYDKSSLSKLNWIPISKPTQLINSSGNNIEVEEVEITEGDTYYQRWDCLKTFPKSLEDTNQVTDITSFMVETHINLDERTDRNRGSFIPVARQENFNLFNTVYNQKNNLFSYTTLNELLSNENSHQVSWSLAKNIAGDVDTWTNITSASAVNLKHPITKLINFNNKVVGLTEHSVEVINFNAKNLVPTDNNTFIELKNSAKVDGTIDFTVDKGSRNKSVLVTEAGLYFIDDNENSLIRLSYNGEIQNLGVGRLDSWFKQNIVPGTYTMYNPNALHLEYDAKYKDIYICNDTSVLVYNELLNEFTSFVDYQELVSLFTNKGKTYAISHTGLDSHLYSLYNGSNYGVGFYNKELPYSIHYRVNPGPYTDKVFTNVEFTADLSAAQENTNTSNSKPFDYIQAWTEYQDTGRQPLTYDRLSNLREKFRTWRAFIPRNNGTRDRIRNPWVHLKLDKSTNSEHEKLEFHNIAITYME